MTLGEKNNKAWVFSELSWERRASVDSHAEAMTEKLRILQYPSVNCMPGTTLCDPMFKKTGHTTPGVLCVAGLQREPAVLQGGLGKPGSCNLLQLNVYS